METRADLDKAITPRTAMMFFLNRYEPLGQIKRDEWIKVGKEHAEFRSSTTRPRTCRRRGDFPSTSGRGLTWWRSRGKGPSRAAELGIAGGPS